MKAIITFNANLEIEIGDKSRDEIVSEDVQIIQMKHLLMEECGCEHVEISEYHIEFK